MLGKPISSILKELKEFVGDEECQENEIKASQQEIKLNDNTEDEYDELLNLKLPTRKKPMNGPDFVARRNEWKSIVGTKSRNDQDVQDDARKRVNKSRVAGFKNKNKQKVFLSEAALSSIQKRIIKVLKKQSLADDTSLLFVIHEKMDLDKEFLVAEAINIGYKGARNFLLESFQQLQKDGAEFLNQLKRNPHIKEGFEKITKSKFYFETTHQRDFLDFQTCLLPLLFVLSHPQLECSPMQAESNLLYSLAQIALPSLLADFITCMEEALKLKTFHSPRQNLSTIESAFFPFSFAQAFYPMVKFLDILFRRFQECARESVNQSLVERLEELLWKWKSAFEEGSLNQTKESMHAVDIVLTLFKKVKESLDKIVNLTERIQLLRARERKEKQKLVNDAWRDPPLQPPRGLFDNDRVNYRDIQLIPTMDEILFDGEICLPGNLTFSPSAHWLEPGPERLLDTHFRLLRMDMISKVRLNIQALIEHLKTGAAVTPGRFKRNMGNQQADFMVYTKVLLKEAMFDKYYGLCYGIKFDLPKLPLKNFNQFKETQLQRDGLLCLIYLDEDAPYSVQMHFCVIARPDTECLPKGLEVPSNSTILISGENIDPLALRDKTTYLIEFQELLFEAYRPVLLSLQKMSRSDVLFPMVLAPLAPPKSQKLAVAPPQYMEDFNMEYSFDFLRGKGRKAGRLMDFSGLEDMEFLETFTPGVDDVVEYSRYLSKETILDESQASCLIGALSSNVCCIQGPPGTGKTFVGVQIVKSLLQLPSSLSKILVMSLTNHALDQFLCRLSEEKIYSMLRISTKENPKLKQFDSSLRPFPKGKYLDFKSVFARIAVIKEGISNLVNELSEPFGIKAVWNFLQAHDPEVVKNIQWPFSSAEQNYLCLEHWLEYKYPSSKKQKVTVNRKESDRKRGCKRFTLLENIKEEMQQVMTIEQLMKDLKLETLPEIKDDEEKAIEVNVKKNPPNVNNFHSFYDILADLAESVDPNDSHDVSSKRDLSFGSDEKHWKGIESGLKRHKVISAPSVLRLPNLSDGEDVEEESKVFEFSKNTSMWELELYERKALYNQWRERGKSLLQMYFSEMKDALQVQINKYKELHNERMAQRIQGAQIIGITTTRASKYIGALKAWGPTVILCEEAGEILEAHILASLYPTVKQLILIGDHKQLRPRISDYNLSVESHKGKQYCLDISLFERLMDPKCHLPNYTLREQRRMKPIISQFIRETIYPELLDGPNVNGRPSIRGMQRDVFFMTHNHPQSTSEESIELLGHSNVFEIDMLLATVAYLLQQGYLPNQIVILTPYLAQLRLIKRKISVLQKKFEHLDTQALSDSNSENGDVEFADNVLRISSVDSFQGEEADIVLISLVRSTLEEGNDTGIGFLKIENRVNVLLSRARHGMYLFGNADLLARCSKMWTKILDIMEEQHLVGPKLPIVCAQHPEERRAIESPDDFLNLAPLGGCLQKCGFEFECGHTCLQTCHIEDPEHAVFKCLLPCEARLPDCGHKCTKLCSEPCGKCEALVEDLRLPMCGHLLKSPKCYFRLELDTVQCEETVTHYRDCGHTFNLLCYENPEDFLRGTLCKESVKRHRPCGHSTVDLPCHEDVGAFFKANPCDAKVLHPRDCGHAGIHIPCKDNVSAFLAKNPCTVKVAPVILPKCGHVFEAPKCHQLKNLANIQCKEEVSLKRPCNHTEMLVCSERFRSKECTLQCGKRLACGHACASLCGKCNCNGRGCHTECTLNCKKQLPCFHTCDGPCKSHASDGSCRVLCKKPCLKTACVHQACSEGCSEVCQPCLFPCTWTCEHQGECPYPCGFPCLRLPCDQRCSKMLECGHRCPSVCGETCAAAAYCIECTPNTNSLGKGHLKLLKQYSSNLNKQPILILSCGHFFPLNVLDHSFHLAKYYEKRNGAWTSFKYPEQVQSQFLACPTCKYPVCEKDIRRYSRIIKFNILTRANETHLLRFPSNLVHATALISRLEPKSCVVQKNELQKIQESIDIFADKIFASRSYHLATHLLDSTLLDTFLHIPSYQLLYHAPQYASLHGQYFVFKARLKMIQKKSYADSLSLNEFVQIRSCMEEVQDLYEVANGYFFQSYASHRQIQLHMERIYADLDYFNTFLEFVIFGEFRILSSMERMHELQFNIQRIHSLLYSLGQMRDDLQNWNLTYLFHFVHRYVSQLGKFGAIFEKILTFSTSRRNKNAKDLVNTAKSILTETACIRKFRMPITSQNVDFSKETHVWQKCLEGHFFPISLEKLKKYKHNRCEDCGAPILNS